MKHPDLFQSKQRIIYEKLFSAPSLCIAGFLAMPSLLFIPVTTFRVTLFLFFWLLCWLAGKKNNPLMTILIILVIVIFNLIIPYGQVLFTIGIFKITLGALMTGIHRAVTLEGLIMLSRISIRPDLKIPGSFGSLVGESFRYFNLITESKPRISRKNLLHDIDTLMTNLSKEALTETEALPQKTKPLGFVILALIVILSWLPWAFIGLL
jgi:heptaprenyl diphosphate synthase